MKIIKHKKTLLFRKFDLEDMRKEMAIFLKPIRKDCFQYTGFHNITVEDGDFGAFLDPEFVFSPQTCPKCGTHECMDCEEFDDKMTYVGRNCGFPPCFNTGHIFRFSFKQLMDAFKSGLSYAELKIKFGMPVDMVKREIEGHLAYLEEEKQARLQLME